MNSGTSYHLMGIGGIGMSGLAQMLAAAGHRVSGSDRALEQPENAEVFAALRAQGITLYLQDGSYLKDGIPEGLIYSTAIEEDNPDFAVAPSVKRIHRAEALERALCAWQAKTRIAVTGSAGKTTTSAWLGETLYHLDLDPAILSGGLLNRFRLPDCVGNFVRGDGEPFVFEADESDKSLVRYHPEMAVILNLGTDHYSKEELIRVFGEFLSHTRESAVMEHSLLSRFSPELTKRLNILTFSLTDPSADFFMTAYQTGHGKAVMTFRAPDGEFSFQLPMPGYHNAANALAVLAAIRLLGISTAITLPALARFSGAWRRFDFCGMMVSGAKVYDDYAHNIEKIASAVSTAREICSEDGRLIIAFQPHGFGPLGFMRSEFPAMLGKVLTSRDLFLLLPVFYAGGTSSFSPTSSEVCADLTASNPVYGCLSPSTRQEAETLIRQAAGSKDTVLILGARDNSLSVWAHVLGAEQ